MAAVYDLPVGESMVDNSLLTQQKFPEVIRQPYPENLADKDYFDDTSKQTSSDDTELKRQQAAEREDEERKAIQG